MHNQVNQKEHAGSFGDFERDLLREGVSEYLAKSWPPLLDCESIEYLKSCENVWRWLVDMEYLSIGDNKEGGGLHEIAIVCNELGKVGCRIPFSGSVLVRSLLVGLSAGSEGEAETLVKGVQSGSHRYTLVLGALDGDPQCGSAVESNGKVTGTIRHVEWSPITNYIALITSDYKLALIEASTEGASITAVKGLARPSLVDLELREAQAVVYPIGRERAAQIVGKHKLTLLSRALGSVERSLELAVSYAKERIQFGKPIGSFQAIQHKLVNCLIASEGASLLLIEAARAVDRKSEFENFYTEAALAYSGAKLRQTILEIHHTFGAIGFSEEHVLPMHFRQVHSDLVRCGGFSRAREKLAEIILSEEGSGKLPDADLGDSVGKFREEIRQWLRDNWGESRKDAHYSLPFDQRGYDRNFSKAVGEKGWIAASWPEEYGGQERTPIEHFVLIEEMDYAGAPVYAHITGGELVGPALLTFGTEEQKKEFLPSFQRGEREFCLGYSEPGSGSDLASLKTRAEQSGDEWIINGQKIWTTRGAESEYIWLAVKTDTSTVPPHAGISIFMVPLDLEGITVRPSMALYGHTFCNIFFDDVRVPSKCLVGEVNGGWKVITHALSAERVLMGGAVGRIRRLLELAIHELRENPTYKDFSANSLCKDRIGELVADLTVARLFALRSVDSQGRGKISPHEASVTKTFSAELMEKTSEYLIDIFGVSATYEEGTENTPLNGFIEQTLRRSIMMVIGGGTAEVQRNQIAIHGLGLPRK